MKNSLFRLLLCAVLLAFSGAASLFAADLPKFSDPEVNAFARDYSAYTDDSIALNKEVAAGKMDSAKMQSLLAKAEPLMNRRVALEAKVKADEKDKFNKFLADCDQRVLDASK